MYYKFWKETDGNVSVVFAISLSTILLCVGVMVDLSLTFSTKSKMQNALDSAVLVAAFNSAEDDYAAYGQQAYEGNLSVSRLTETTVNFRKENNKMVGFAEGSLPTLFAGVLPKSALDIKVRSVATVSVNNSTPCIIALSQTASPGITVNGGTTIEGDGCEMHTHSESGNALTANAGINITLDKTCVAGSRVVNNSNGGIGNLEMNCAAAADPYAGSIPEPTSVNCDYTHGNYNSARMTLYPGVYCGWHNFNNSNAQIEFEPGLYIIRNGGWNVNGGEWSGDDVTFYFNDNNSKIQFNSGVEAEMSAPSTGDYKGIFITERPNLSNGSFIMNDNEGFNFEGVVYLPSKNIVMNGGSTMVARKMILIGDRISFNSSYLSLEVDNKTAGAVISPYLSE